MTPVELALAELLAALEANAARSEGGPFIKLAWIDAEVARARAALPTPVEVHA